MEEFSQHRQIIQLAEYVGVDYESAIKDGQVINDDEYQEMLEFSKLIVEKTSINNNYMRSLNEKALALQTAISTKQNANIVRKITSELRISLLAMMPELPLPKRLLSKEATFSLFENNCASCHGISGQGNGVLASGLEPAPTDFTDKTRAENRSLLGLFDAISNGLDDTAMPAFTQLKEQQKWSLAFYVGGLAFKSSSELTKPSQSISLQNWINYSPLKLSTETDGLTKNEIEGLRANPTLLFTNQSSPIAITKTQLAAASNAYKNEEYEKAKTLAVSAYLDGFELIENSLDARDKDLRKSIEGNLIKLRQVLSNAQQVNQFESLMEITVGQLHDAEELLTETTLSNEALFTASLVILLREGLEALLVVLALITVLIRTKRHDALKYVHFGWFSALLAGFATWAVAQSIINISGASREVMEGIAAMVAAVMLFYVGIWMHSKTNAEHWQAYIQKHINSQLEAGTLWGLAVLSFIAVYREVFETVLFYQSLVTQASTTQYSFVISGFLFGVAVLSILAWGMFRYSVKLPIARFFSTTTYLLLVLSFILMGKAISALQEAAIIGITPLPINVEVTWFGIGSTWQGITAQVTILILFSLYMYRSRNRNAS
ncbi:cytochrome c/FTR1 family iron permease [Colwellia sp. 1_MG-2023]|uniref:cytochrome c/FTR1 family iron permease n=1 Tax=Colwellia sp. 1_MG-2023 TaxID=3062649 RepID=UPI0026E26996|nr:cytochrome c/FTR1 family iron permease [Colwellia sp. 1_MG-2023]MDO6445655.1 cytochrome c/FTR1 family iron permease [Colwellia sp. 1_MG-2023]